MIGGRPFNISSSEARAAWEMVIGATLPVSIKLEVADLPAGHLGETRFVPGGNGGALAGTIVIDINGDGAGWFLDTTPLDDREFDDDAPALSGYDLLTVLMHEIGHLSGFSSQVPTFAARVATTGDGAPRFVGDDFEALLSSDGNHLSDATYPGDLMGHELSVGQRRLPSVIDAEILRALWSLADDADETEADDYAVAVDAALGDW